MPHTQPQNRNQERHAAYRTKDQQDTEEQLYGLIAGNTRINNPIVSTPGISGGVGGGGSLADPIVQKVEALGDVNGDMAIDPELANYFTMTLTGDTALTIGASSGAAQVVTLQILQDDTGGHSVSWGGSVNGTPSVNTAVNGETIVVLLTFDSGVTWEYALGTAGGGSGGITSLSQLVIDSDKDWGDYTVTNIAIENADVLGLKARASTPSAEVAVYRTDDDLRFRSDSVSYRLTDFWIPNIQAADANKYLQAIDDVPTWSDLPTPPEQSIENLKEWTDPSNGNPGYLTFPSGAEIRAISRLRFNTSFFSELSAFETPSVKTNADGSTYISQIRGVMDMALQATDAGAVLNQVSISAVKLPVAPYFDEAAVEVKSNRMPALKTVDEGYYTDTSSVLDREIGTLHFDGYAEILDGSGNITERVQTTFASIHAHVEKGNIIYAAWSDAVTYEIGQHVTYDTKNYRCISKLSFNNQPDISNSIWTEINENVLDRGKLQFTLRDVNRNTIGQNTDTFLDIMTLDIDSGVFIDHNLKLPATAFAQFNGGVSIGSPEGNAEGYGFDVLSDMLLHNYDVHLLGRLNFGTKTPSGFNGSMWFDGTSIKARLSDTHTVDLANIGATNPDLDLSAVAQDYIPAQTDTYTIGTSTHVLANVYTDTISLGSVDGGRGFIDVISDELAINKKIVLTVSGPIFKFPHSSGQTGLTLDDTQWQQVEVDNPVTGKKYYIPVYVD